MTGKRVGVVRGVEKRLDQNGPFVGACLVGKGLDLAWCWDATGEVEEDPSDKGGVIASLIGSPALLRLPACKQKVDHQMRWHLGGR